jgi:hypothetical protein
MQANNLGVPAGGCPRARANRDDPAVDASRDLRLAPRKQDRLHAQLRIVISNRQRDRPVLVA